MTLDSYKLSLDQAQRVTHDFGKYLEVAGFVVQLFMSAIPELLLPYPKEVIQQALDIMSSYYNEKGDTEAVNQLVIGRTMLMGYINSEKAFSDFAKLLETPNFKNLIFPKLEEMQRDRLKSINMEFNLSV
jgi:hypothetical protein